MIMHLKQLLHLEKIKQNIVKKYLLLAKQNILNLYLNRDKYSSKSLLLELLFPLNNKLCFNDPQIKS